MREYYTLEEAAAEIGTNVDGVLKLAGVQFPLTPAGAGLSPQEYLALRDDSSLALASRIDHALLAREVGGNDELVEIPPGLYEIGVFPYCEQGWRIAELTFDSYGRAKVNQLTRLVALKRVEVKRREDGKVIPVFDQELNAVISFCGWFENSKTYVLSDRIDVNKNKLVILTDRLRFYMESNGKALNIIDSQHQQIPDEATEPSNGQTIDGETGRKVGGSNKVKHHLLKIAIERLCTKLTRDAGRFPQYKAVLDAINAEANADGELGKLVESAGMKGIRLVGEDKPLGVHTLQNWITDDIKPNVFKTLGLQIPPRKSRKKPQKQVVPKKAGL